VNPTDCGVPLEVSQGVSTYAVKNIEFIGDKELELQYGDVMRQFVSSYMYCALMNTVQG